ncbi:MAG: carboxylating nicotinate-nucleotide diphosphorylase [Dehalococcoidia bacterium]|nr:carboxylating nicotinate-nucleotide diphosphorylase [Dehalococcoidia bacterium]
MKNTEQTAMRFQSLKTNSTLAKFDTLLQEPEVKAIIKLALAEDRYRNDITTQRIIPLHLESKAVLLAKNSGVLAGIGLFEVVFKHVNPRTEITLFKYDSTDISSGDIVAEVSGNTRSILRAERTALNFIGHLSGIASLTSQYVERIKGTRACISDTRKTSAGQRLLEKYAVACGGGQNHRQNLSDGILIKDNHLAALAPCGKSLTEIVIRAKTNNDARHLVEVEVNSQSQAEEAAAAGADILLLDNMSIAEMRSTIDKLYGKVRFEASGGITLQNVREIAETGVDTISIGALTHSVKVFDFSLEVLSDSEHP